MGEKEKDPISLHETKDAKMGLSERIGNNLHENRIKMFMVCYEARTGMRVEFYCTNLQQETEGRKDREEERKQ